MMARKIIYWVFVISGLSEKAHIKMKKQGLMMEKAACWGRAEIKRALVNLRLYRLSCRKVRIRQRMVRTIERTSWVMRVGVVYAVDSDR